MAEEQVSDSKKEENKLIYLFTSTWQPYIKDALDLLALPPGMIYRFRYDIKYLGEEFFTDATKTQLKDLPTKDAIIIHVRTTPKDILPEGEMPKIIESVPIRKARIIEAKLMGDFLWLQFELKHWIKYNERRNTSINPYHDIIKNVLPEPKDELKFTAVIGKLENFDQVEEKNSEHDNVIGNWINIVSFIQNFEEHNKSVFLKLLKIVNLENLKKLSLYRIFIQDRLITSCFNSIEASLQ